MELLNVEVYLLGGMGSGILGATQGRHHNTLEPARMQQLQTMITLILADVHQLGQGDN